MVRPVKISIRAASLILLGGLLLLTGCIQPIGEVDQTRTAQATLGIFGVPPTQPTAALVPAANTPIAPTRSAEEQFVLNRRDVPGNLAVWYAQALGPDMLRAFSYVGQTGTPCAGYVVLIQAGGAWQLTDNGALVCAAQPAAETVAATMLFLLSNGEPQTIVFGRVMTPSVSAVSVTFDDGTVQAAAVLAGGVVLVRPGVTGVTSMVGLDAQGNVVLPSIPLSPVLS